MIRGVYRDALQGKRARVDELRRDVQDRRARVTEELLTFLPAALTERLLALEGEIAARGETLDEISRIERALEQCRECLDEAIEMAPAITEACLRLPDTVDEPRVGDAPWSVALLLPWVRQRVSRSVGRLWGKLRGILTRKDRSAEIRWSLHAFQARFRVNGDPFALVAEVPNLTADPLELDFAVATSVPRAAPRLVVEPGGYVTSIVETFGAGAHAKVGDERFDALFQINATGKHAKRALTKEVRTALLALAHFDLPWLEVRSARAVLRWRFEPEARAIDAAVRALSGVRHSPVDLQLLLGEDD